MYKNGLPVVASLFGKDITEVVVAELKKLGFTVDWHFIRNRIVVRTLDDVVKVRAEWWRIIRKHGLDYHWQIKFSQS